MTTQEDTLTLLWESIVRDLEYREDSTPRLIALLRGTKLMGFLDATAIIGVANEGQRDFFERRGRQELSEAISRAMGKPITIAVTVNPDLERSSVVSAPATSPHTQDSAPTPDAPRSLVDREPVVPKSLDEGHRLNPKYIFETFVIGSSNRFAHAAAVAVAEAPAKAYNPLFIYGGSGLGKTHLLHAIGNYALNLYPSAKVKYVNSEEFTNDFINSIRDEKAGAFQRRHREVDFLLIDDIQFLQGKEATMEEFFHTFNALHNANKQVVITSDLPPKQLAGFEDRLRSRFSGD